ncbi:MFS transporter [Amycolatopsis saalfeldensis]|uniref:Predicted arabinose efflux permease, MFS family n=1 Tax=Amycolatopsis saalfeldensis TaxID=394193 RepID=A0A1H8Y8K2_9PSEU|nr:MFS transporter [Amycolatopsis saalfeldensis]SEP48407.1 Predicted arabinose efflux permease, MFS family [Amycolatopsis saalfeldensis]
MTAASIQVEKTALPRVFHVWLGGALVSQLGDAALYFALGWAASAHGGLAAAWVLSAVALPRTLLLLFGGAVGDRLGARQVMIVGDAVMLVVAVALAVVSGAAGIPLVMLVIAALVVGTNDAFYLPSAGSMPRRLVEPGLLPRAVALRQSGTQLVGMVGPPIGGALVAFSGLSAAAWIDATTFAVVLVVLMMVRPRFTPPSPGQRQHILREVGEGIRVVVKTAGLGPVLLLVAGAAGFVLPFTSLLIPLLARSHGWSSAGAGFVVGAQSVGTIVAALIISRRGILARPGMVATCALAMVAVGQLIVGFAPSIPVALAGGLVTGAASGVFVGHLSPLLLSAAPDTHLARVQAILSVIQSVTLLATNNIIGSVANAFGPRAGAILCSAVLLACAATGLASRPIRRISRPA